MGTAISSVFFNFLRIFEKIYAVGDFFEYRSTVVCTGRAALFHNYGNILRIFGRKAAAEPGVADFIAFLSKIPVCAVAVFPAAENFSGRAGEAFPFSTTDVSILSIVSLDSALMATVGYFF